MSPGGARKAWGEDREEPSSIRPNPGVALRQHHFAALPHSQGELTGEVLAVAQVQLGELHVLERRDVTWWGGKVRWGGAP